MSWIPNEYIEVKMWPGKDAKLYLEFGERIRL